MSSIPEAWPPPQDEADETRVYPLFVLPDVWLFPFAILPLHVFEPRYRKMVEDGLDGPGRIVIGTARAGHAGEESPPFHETAGLGEIGRHERLADGRFHILLVGLRRVHAVEVESDRPYRLVEARPLQEIPVPTEREDELRGELIHAIQERTEGPIEKSKLSVPITYLADILFMSLMPMPHGLVSRLYAELDAEKRARAILAEHALRPKPKG